MAAEAADQRDDANLVWLAKAAAAAKTENASALVIAMQADMTDVSGSVLGQPCAGPQADREKRCDAFVALRNAVREAAENFDGPTLLIHGDTAPFTLGQSFAGDGAANLWVLNAAGDHGVTNVGFHYGVLDATLITIQPDAAAPFLARGLVTGAQPEAK
jgi:pimeloyl-ACP methyl ester carboxylesterase